MPRTVLRNLFFPSVFLFHKKGTGNIACDDDIHRSISDSDDSVIGDKEE